MIRVVGVSLDNKKQLYYFNPKSFDLRRNVTIIVQTERGLQFGKVEMPPFSIVEKKLKYPLKDVIRISTKKDYLIHKKNLKDAELALKKCRELISKYSLNMQVIDASFTFDRSQLLFRFVADNRVDFRELARELANRYKTRIELRQIGVRDKAKKVGGYGTCGQKLCCARFLNDFDSISISMAKNQNISLNPNKINGLCGRLLCCLKYENECYKECKKILPKIGEIKQVDDKKGIIRSVNLIKGTYTLELENGELLEVKQEYGRN